MNHLYPLSNSNEDLFNIFDESPALLPQPISPAPSASKGRGNGKGSNARGQTNGKTQTAESPTGKRQNGQGQSNGGSTRRRSETDELDELLGFAGSFAAASIVGDRAPGSASDQSISPDIQKFGAAMTTIKTELEKAGALNQPELRENLQQVVNLFRSAHEGIEELVEMGVQQQLQSLQQQSTVILQDLKQAANSKMLLQVAVASIRTALKTDRVMLLHCINQTQATVLAEMISPGEASLRSKTLPVSCFGCNQVADYANTAILAIEDTYTSQMPTYQQHFLARLQVGSSLVMPIVVNQQVWGLLAVFHSGEARRWQEIETNLLWQIVSELSLQLQVVQSQSQLSKVVERERAIARVVGKLRQSFDVNAIFNVVTQEIRKLLNVERLTIYKFRDNYFGDFIAESVANDYPKLVGSGWEDSYLHEHKGGRLRDNIPLVVDDIYTGETVWENGRLNLEKSKRSLSACHVEALESYEVRACLVVSIFQGDQLWGLLSAFQNTSDRTWEDDDVRLMMQVANQIGIAMPQALYTAQLAKTADRERSIARVVGKLRQTLDINSIFSVVTQEVRRLLNVERLTIYKFRDNYTGGDFITESILGDYPKLVGSGWEDSYLHQHKGGRFLTNQPFVADNIYTGETLWENGGLNYSKPRRSLSACHIEVLEGYQVKAFAIVGIYQGDRLWGLLSAFQNTAPRRWEDDDIRLMMQIADQISIAMQQAEYATQLAKTVEREKIISRLTAKIRQNLDLGSVFATATQELRQVLKCDRVGIYRFREDWSGEFITESVGAGWAAIVQAQEKDAALRGDFVTYDRCIVKNLSAPPTPDADTYLQQTQGGDYKSGCPYKQVDDIYAMNYSRCYLETLEKFQCRASIVVPIFRHGKLWGLLGAYQNSGPRKWQESEIKIMLQLPGSLEVAINQAEYLSQIQEQTRKAAKEVEVERALARVIEKIRKYPEMKTIFDNAVQEIRKLLGVERVTIYKFHPDHSGDILAEAKLGDHPSLLGVTWEDPYIQENQGGRFRNHEPLVVDDVYQAGMADCHVAALEFYQLRACAVVAIFKGQQLWGLLSAFQHSSPRHWEDSEVSLLTQISAQLGFALQQLDYLDQLQTQAKEGALAIAREIESKEQIQRNVLQLLMSVRPALTGDLTVRAPITEDEVGTVADAYNNTLQSLRQLVIQVQTAATQVGQTSKANGGAIAGLADQAQQESQEIAQVLQQMQAMADSTQAVATNAQQVDTAVQQANAIVQQGDAAMNRTVDGILGIRETVSETSKKIKRLSESSQKISKVVSLISTFTSQTQLLALNAAIEATRAGEAGRGFAVVADEVRALARRSAEATTDIEKLVQEIQIETSTVATAMDEGIEQVINGTALVNETRQSLNEIVTATAQISQLVRAITQTAQTQTQQSEAVTGTMTEVAAIAQRTSTEAIQISASFQDLLATAEALQTSIGQFKVN